MATLERPFYAEDFIGYRTFLRGRICRDCGAQIPDDKQPWAGYQEVAYTSCVEDGCVHPFDDCDHQKNPVDPDDPFGGPALRCVNVGEPFDRCETCDEHESLWHSERDYD